MEKLNKSDLFSLEEYSINRDSLEKKFSKKSNTEKYI